MKLTARGEQAMLDEKDERKYTVKAKDSKGEDDAVGFTIRSSMSFEPPVVALGSRLTIIITDWEKTRGNVVAVKIAGQPQFLSKAYYLTDCIHHPDAPRASGAE